MIYQITIILLIFQLYLGRKDLKYAIVFLIILTFLIPYIIKFNLGGINLNVFNLSTLLFTLCSLKYLKKRNLQYVSLRKFTLFIIGYFLITSIPTIEEYGIAFFIKNAILTILEYYLIAYCFFYIKLQYKQIQLINISIVIVSIIVTIYAIINYITHINPYITYLSMLTDSIDMSATFQEEQRGILDGRVSSTFTHPLILGQMMLLTFSYIVFQLKHKINPILYTIICTLITIPIILCGSRSTLFPLILVPCFYFYFSGIKKFIKYIILAIFLIPICINLLPKDYKLTAEAMIYIWDSSKETKAGIQGSNKDMRKQQIIDASKIIDNNPLFGKGNGYVKEFGSKHPEMLGYEGLLLYTLVDFGFIGSMVFLFFYYFLYKYILFKAHTKEEKVQATSLCMCYFICILLTGIAYSTFSFFFLLYFLTLNTFRLNHNFTIKHSLQ